MNNYLKGILLFAFLVFSVSASAEDREYKLKASFLDQFAHLTSWPDDLEISDLSKPFIISIIGYNPFGGILDNRYLDNKINNRNVIVKYISSPDKILGSHLLFISESMKKEVPNILSITRNKPILTISEMKGFAKQGGHINFYHTDKDTLHFEINEPMVNRSGLRMHLLLIEVGKKVKQ